MFMMKKLSTPTTRLTHSAVFAFKDRPPMHAHIRSPLKSLPPKCRCPSGFGYTQDTDKLVAEILYLNAKLYVAQNNRVFEDICICGSVGGIFGIPISVYTYYQYYKQAHFSQCDG
eukprot:992180_1